MTLFVKNMVCARCVRTVERLAAVAGLPAHAVRLGEIDLETEPGDEQLSAFRTMLATEGFDLLDDRNSRLISQVKSLIIEEIHHGAGKKPETMNFSDFLARETRHEYSQLSKLFSTVEGITIEKYIIAQRIERVKELLVYDERSLSEIAWEMGYSSVQHLSNQFRQVMGMTPTQFKTDHPGHHHRRHLDAV